MQLLVKQFTIKMFHRGFNDIYHIIVVEISILSNPYNVKIVLFTIKMV